MNAAAPPFGRTPRRPGIGACSDRNQGGPFALPRKRCSLAGRRAKPNEGTGHDLDRPPPHIRCGSRPLPARRRRRRGQRRDGGPGRRRGRRQWRDGTGVAGVGQAGGVGANGGTGTGVAGVGPAGGVGANGGTGTGVAGVGPNGGQSTGGSGSPGGGTTGGNGSPGGAPSPSPGGDGHGYIWRNQNSLHVNFCGGALRLPNPDKFVYADNGVRAVSRITERYLNQCECETKECIAAALDSYAAELAVLAPRLGPDLQDLPRIVSTAARRVRAARTNSEAVAALQQAVAAVHKDIGLIRVSDPDFQASETRGGDFVAEALDVAAAKLERANEI